MRRSASARRTDPAREAAFRTLRAVTADDAYANLALAEHTAGLSPRDAAFATELVAGTCRGLGLFDAIIASAAGRELRTLQPAVVDLLRLGTHQLLDLRVPTHAAIAATVELARAAVSERVTGVVNAVLRKVVALDAEGWAERLRAERPDAEALLARHPQWIIDAFADVLPAAELGALLDADNTPPVTHLVVRPGLAEVADLGGEPLRWSPFGARADGSPGGLAAVREGRAGVQDEGSQLVAWALARADAPDGPWLDTCAGPGGKAALLAGLARQAGGVPAGGRTAAAPGRPGRQGRGRLPRPETRRGRRRRHPPSVARGQLRPGHGGRPLHRAGGVAPSSGIAVAAAAGRSGRPGAAAACPARGGDRRGSPGRSDRLRDLLAAPPRDDRGGRKRRGR